MKHRHAAVKWRTADWGWTHCLAPGRCDGAAHGNIERREYCACGANRLTEINGPVTATTGWFVPQVSREPLNRDRLREIAAGLERALERGSLDDARGYAADLRQYAETGRIDHA